MANKSKAKASETSPQILMMGYLCIKGVDDLTDQVKILDRFGLGDVDTATICNKAVQTIRDTRQRLRKKAKTKSE
jgi:hypothetical protein